MLDVQVKAHQIMEVQTGAAVTCEKQFKAIPS
jgi:hypothetical protein